MIINSDYRSPNFHNKEVDMSFIVLHYTACSLEETLKIFLDSNSQVSAHFVINTDGQVYNCVELNKPAWHAGQSHFQDEKNKKWKSFNDFSIGIELINLNGNLFLYSDLQYESLFELIKYLQNKYPLLKEPNKILGHEHIAGFRGKADPGCCFDWKKLFTNCYAEKAYSIKKSIISSALLQKYQDHLSLFQQKNTPINFKELNLDLEKEIAESLK